MNKDKVYRYTESKGKYEKQSNIHIREMIEMIKNEQVKANLYVKAVKLSAHAYKRIEQHFKATNLAAATKIAKDMLRHAVRIGTVLSYDGRINVLYAYRQTAFYLSPDLKTLVTVNKFPNVTYKPLLKEISDVVDTEKILELHFNYLREIERQEEEQMQLILSIEQKVSETTAQCATMLSLVKGGERKKDIKKSISEMNAHLKAEGRKLFELKIEKRHLCKSIVALY